MTGFLLAPLVLAQLSSALRASAEPSQSHRAWCHDSGACYSVHVASLNFNEAQQACRERGGGLSTASGKAEVEAIFAHLREVASETGAFSFWLGLAKKPQQCTLGDLPLRGFSWASPWPPRALPNETLLETPSWVEEPTTSCVKLRCAGLHVAAKEPPLQRWGLKDQPCHHANPGFICKYRSQAGCPALHTPGARNLAYTLPSQMQSATLQFSPPGTVLTLACPTREARFTCRLLADGGGGGGGYQWEGTEERLCSCPSGYWSPDKGGCVEPEECVGAQGAFLCLCVWGSRLAAEKKSCWHWQAEGGRAEGTPGRLPAQNSSLLERFPDTVPVPNSSIPAADEILLEPDSSSYVLIILLTVAVVILVILVMAAMQCCQSCPKSCSSKGSQPVKNGVPVAAKDDDPEASAALNSSVQSLGPSKEESAEASEGDLKPLDGRVETEQPQADQPGLFAGQS